MGMVKGSCTKCVNMWYVYVIQLFLLPPPQIPASAVFWKNASCYQLKKLISKPFKNILEIPPFPWNADINKSDVLGAFFSLPWNADNPINALTSVPEKAGNRGCDSNNSLTGLWMKRLLDQEITPDRAGLWNNNTDIFQESNIVIMHHSAQQLCVLTAHNPHLVTQHQV